MELLVVLAILGITMSLLMPAVQTARAAARRTQCSHHLRQMSLAAHGFHTAHQAFPPGLEQHEFAAPPRFRGTSLFAYLLPYLEENSLVGDWDYDFPLQNASGGAAAKTAAVIPLLLCPADSLPSQPVEVGGRFYGLTSYGGNGGSRGYHPQAATADGLFHTTGPAAEPDPAQRPVRLADVADGASRTILLGERSHHDPNYATFADAHWSDSLAHLGRWAAIGGRRRIGDVTMSAFAPINYTLPHNFDARSRFEPPLVSFRDFEVFADRRISAFGSGHSGGANFAWVDGSVRLVAQHVPQLVLRAWCTRAGHEAIAYETHAD